MTKITGKIWCGDCKSDLTGPADYDNESVFTCPKCGQSEKYGKIIEEVQAYFTDSVKRQIDKKMDEMAKQSKFITVKTPFAPPARNYRFIVDKLPTMD